LVWAVIGWRRIKRLRVIAFKRPFKKRVKHL
jgi:hypothetical protein